MVNHIKIRNKKINTGEKAEIIFIPDYWGKRGFY